MQNCGEAYVAEAVTTELLRIAGEARTEAIVLVRDYPSRAVRRTEVSVPDRLPGLCVQGADGVVGHDACRHERHLGPFRPAYGGRHHVLPVGRAWKNCH